MKVSKKVAITSLAIASLILVAGASYYLFALNPEPTERTQNNTGKNDNLADNKNDDSTTESKSTAIPVDAPNKTPVQYTPPDNADEQENPDSIIGIITSKSVHNDNLVLRTNINNIISSGTCKLTLVRQSDGKKYTDSAEIINNPSSSSCMGFDIPVTKLGDGKWDILITVTSGSKYGEMKGHVAL